MVRIALDFECQSLFLYLPREGGIPPSLICLSIESNHNHWKKAMQFWIGIFKKSGKHRNKYAFIDCICLGVIMVCIM